RKEKVNFEVTNQTLNRESAVMNQMLSYAADYGWIDKDVKIKYQSERHSRNRRPHFTDEELKVLLETAEKRANEYHNSDLSLKRQGLLITKYWQRILLKDIIIV